MKKTIYLLLTLCFVFFSNTLRAQSWAWAVKAGGISTDNVKDMYVDATGNSYITGIFSGTATFGSLASMVMGDAVCITAATPTGTESKIPSRVISSPTSPSSNLDLYCWNCFLR